jgi:thiamine biosynthesis lipoprotein
MLQIHHPDPATADRLIRLSLAEVARLEAVFSLYRPDSALVRLNRDGFLDHPPLDLLRLLAECTRLNRLTDGAFDATVQPLWEVYAAHFNQPNANPAGPSRRVLEEALARIGQDRVRLDARRIEFAAKGMAITLNGIAQGYVTDRVVDLLRDVGISQSLVDMGETRVIGTHPSGQPWSVGLEDPHAPGRIAQRIELSDRAVATSGGYGMQFDAAGRFNHLLDPSNGTTSWRYAAVSVVAEDATTADALSTSFSLMPWNRTQRVLDALGLYAHFALASGNRILQAAKHVYG